jgi:aspartyl-tRNA(Asn)/glutamyl-tRNA(Gln) amidotransferase subunit A
MEVTALTLSEASKWMTRHRLTPYELTQAYIQRIHEIDPQLNSFITVIDNDALQRSQTLEQGPSTGRPLVGIPVAVKDVFATKSIRTTAASRLYENNFPTTNSAVVEKLYRAGTVVVGKLNMHELDLSTTPDDDCPFGVVRNPWRREYIPGGSSSGCGAALAADLCLGAVGTDADGSVRIPAALCGVVGLKPTYGRVSLRGAISPSLTLDHVGPMARTVKDVAALLQAIAGYDPDDPNSANVLTPNYRFALHAGVIGMRIAIASGGYFDRADSEVLQAVQKAAETIAGLGALVQRVEFPNMVEARRLSHLILVYEAASLYCEPMQAAPERFGDVVRGRLNASLQYNYDDYQQAQLRRLALKRQFEEFFDHFDVLLMPTTPVAAPMSDASSEQSLVYFTAPFNLTGLPALSIPCGFTRAGLPIGLQMITRSWAEEDLLRTAYAYEQATEWHLRSPAL